MEDLELINIINSYNIDAIINIIPLISNKLNDKLNSIFNDFNKIDKLLIKYNNKMSSILIQLESKKNNITKLEVCNSNIKDDLQTHNDDTIRKIDIQIKTDNDNARQLKILNKRKKKIQTNIFHNIDEHINVEHINVDEQINHDEQFKIIDQTTSKKKYKSNIKNNDEEFAKLIRHNSIVMLEHDSIKETSIQSKPKKKKVNKRMQKTLPYSMVYN